MQMNQRIFCKKLLHFIRILGKLFFRKTAVRQVVDSYCFVKLYYERKPSS